MIDDLLSKLEKVKRIGYGKWIARCPCHQDRTPSLSIKDDNGTILIHCFGCGVSGVDVCNAVGMDVSDLFPPVDIDPDYERIKMPGRKFGIGADQAMYCLQREAMIIYIIANDMLQNKSIDTPTMDRLRDALRRVHTSIALYKE